MRWTLIFLCFCLAVSASAEERSRKVPVDEPIDDMPKLVFREFKERHVSETYPYWVSQSMVLNSNGEVDPALFSPGRLRIIENILANHPGGKSCRTSEGIPVGDLRVKVSLEETLDRAEWIVLAEVSGMASGLQGSRLTTMVRVEPLKTLRGSESRTGSHYFFIPAGAFTIGEKHFCIEDSHYPVLPRVGDRVVLMVEDIWPNQGQFLRGLLGNQMILLGADGKISGDPRLMDLEKAWALERLDAVTRDGMSCDLYC